MSPVTGIGIDVEEIARIARAVECWRERFTTRIFTRDEIAYCERRKNPAQHYAARFAAKEALGKAIGTGWSSGFRWRDAEVVNETSGRPSIRLHNALARACDGIRTHISITHTSTHVTAVVVLESPLLDTTGAREPWSEA